VESTKPKLPSEAVELYNKFIHGGMSRRAFMDGVQRLAIGGISGLGDHRGIDAELRARPAGITHR
jgi:hypothetical protein